MHELIKPARRALRLLRGVSQLGAPGALAGPPELLPMGARVLSQGYLNRFALPLLRTWLLPAWMRAQTDPDSPAYTPRSVTNLMANQTARNWTPLGIPGQGHPVESIIDRYGMLTPVPGGPSFDFWVDQEGSAEGLMAASRQPSVLQRMQGGLPVVLTAYEAQGLRVSTEAWMLAREDGDWTAVQIVLFNIADMQLRGTFWLALRPYDPEGISPIYTLAFDGRTLVADGRPGPLTWPKPEWYALSGLKSGDLFNLLPGSGSGSYAPEEAPVRLAGGPSATLVDPHGFAHGALGFSFDIEPWEEAEFIAFAPVHPGPNSPRPERNSLFNIHSFEHPATDLQPLTPDAHYYSRAKAATTLEWRRVLGMGMKLQLPHRDLQASWEANVEHMLALHDGDSITPGPDLYHSVWVRDAAYMAYALSASGFKDATVPLLEGFARQQRSDGAFLSQQGEWDGTGQVLWTVAQHLALHPDPELGAKLLPALRKGAHWIARTLTRSADGLMPPGISAEHLGPPDRYYWDDLWSLAGLEAVSSLFEGRDNPTEWAIRRLRSGIREAWHADVQRLQGYALPAAPGRGIDFGAVGTLVAWFPLGLLSPKSRLLDESLAAIEEVFFYKGALLVNTGHSGWGTYLNMRIAGCRLLQGSQRGWELMRWLLDHASPTFNWPEAVHPLTGGGSAGDGHHGWASAEWLLLVRALLMQESGDSLALTPVLPASWLLQGSELVVENAPTRFGTLDFRLDVQQGGSHLELELAPSWRRPPGQLTWYVPGDILSVRVDGVQSQVVGRDVSLPATARLVEVVMASPVPAAARQTS